MKNTQQLAAINSAYDQVRQKTGISERDWVEASLSKNKIALLQGDHQRYWLKKAEKKHRQIHYAILGKVSKWFGLELLKPVAVQGGRASIQIERERLTRLADQGVLVPQVVSYSDDWLLLSDLGFSSGKVLQRIPEKAKALRREKVTQISNSIIEVHQKGQYLSQAFDRNICFVGADQSKIGYIDFEDDPITVFSLEDAQARDCLFFAHSYARYFLNDQLYFQSVLRSITASCPMAQREKIQKVVKKLAWLNKLPFQKKLGSDYRRVVFAINALSTTDDKC